LRFALASCQDWQNGHFTAYDDMAEQDLDFAVATEFVGTSISSDFPAETSTASSGATWWPESTNSQWRSDYRVVATVDLPVSPAFTRRSWTVADGVPGAHQS
jgi:alkaline phosphatase D